MATCIDRVKHPGYGGSGGLADSVGQAIWRHHNPGTFNLRGLASLAHGDQVGITEIEETVEQLDMN